ncbi:hypothetical protein GOD82_29765 [Sinorhizobium medicae]|nr:hypothetical protein [Sinorhizobium medicae]
MRNLIVAGAAALSLAGCATTPATPMEAHLNRYAGAEAVAMNCPAYGGYGSVAQMRADAQKNLARAKALGATEADVAKARQRVNSNLMGATVLVGPIQACSAFVNSLAWAGSEPAVVRPVAKKKQP